METTEQTSSEQVKSPVKKPSVLKALLFSVFIGVVTYFAFTFISRDPDGPWFFGVFVGFVSFLIAWFFMLPKLFPNKYYGDTSRLKKFPNPYDISDPGYYNNLTNPSNPTYIHRHQSWNH